MTAKPMIPRETFENLRKFLYEDHNADAISALRALLAERDALRAAIQKAVDTLYECPRIERGAGGMSIDAQISRTVINGVPAILIEELYEALHPIKDAPDV